MSKLKLSSLSPNVVIIGLVSMGVIYLLYKWTIDDDDDGSNSAGAPKSIFEQYPDWVKRKSESLSDYLMFSPAWWYYKFKNL